MSNELSPTDEVQAQVVQLGARNRNTARAAQTALASRGEAGIAAVIWVCPTQTCECDEDAQAFWTIAVPTPVLSHCGRWRWMIQLPLFVGWLSIL